MKLFLYTAVYSCVMLGLFCTLIYLMTVLDPGLLALGQRAAAMLRADRGQAEPEGFILESRDYMSLESLTTTNKTPNQQ